MFTTDTKPRVRETWETWLPDGVDFSPDELMTREDLISTLANRGITVTQIDLRNWQQAGAIPYGDRRWDEKTRKTRTVYPPPMIQLIQRLRQYQHEGLRLHDIGPRLRAFLIAWANSNAPFDPERPAGPDEGFETPVNDLLRIKPLLREFANTHSRQTGRRVTRVEVRLNLDEEHDNDNRVSGLSVDVLDESGALFNYSWP